MADHIFVRRLVEEHGRFRQQAEEPAARLVEALGDEIRRETGLEDLLVLERIVVQRPSQIRETRGFADGEKALIRHANGLLEKVQGDSIICPSLPGHVKS